LCTSQAEAVPEHWLLAPLWADLHSPSAAITRRALTDLNEGLGSLKEAGSDLGDLLDDVQPALLGVLERYQATAGVLEAAIKCLWTLSLAANIEARMVACLPPVISALERHEGGCPAGSLAALVTLQHSSSWSYTTYSASRRACAMDT
jgi:hypothetical protein